MRLDHYRPKMDYIRQVQSAVEPAIAGFQSVRERYGKVDPEPNKVVVRSVPEYVENESQMYIEHWRISVPSGKPVYLRSGIRTESNNRGDSNLDRYKWLKDSPFTDSNSYEIQLEPGIVDLWMFTRNSESNVQVQLQLGDQQLVSTVFTDDYSGRSWSGPSGRVPFSFSLKKRNVSLIKFSLGSDSPRHEYWIWLSSKPDVEGFKPFPVIPMAQFTQVQESFKATADE